MLKKKVKFLHFNKFEGEMEKFAQGSPFFCAYLVLGGRGCNVEKDYPSDKYESS